MIGNLLDTKINPIVKTLDEVKSKISKLESIEKSILFLSDKYDELIEKVKRLESKNDHLQQENSNLKSEVHRSTDSIAQLKQEVNNMEQYSRRDCVEIRGIPLTDDEDTDELVKEVGKIMDVQIED
jgi:chromosome segregation ATPase